MAKKPASKKSGTLSVSASKTKKPVEVVKSVELVETALTDQENNAHEQLIEKDLQNSDATLAFDAAEESTELEAENKIEDAPFPRAIKMLKKFRFQYPLPSRRDASMMLTLKVGQEIRDPLLIGYLLKSSDAPFTITE